MKPFLCNPTAYRIMESVEKDIDAGESLLRGCLALDLAIQTGRASISFGDMDGQLRSYADTIKMRARSGNQQALLAHLVYCLYDELKFTGNEEDYYTLDSQFVTRVLASKRGGPQALGVIFVEVARRIGFNSYAISTPGHLHVALETDGAVMYFDPQTGRNVTPQEIEAKVQEMRFAPVPLEQVLRPHNNLEWLMRMQQSINRILALANDFERLAACIELQYFIFPHPKILRELGLVYSRGGHFKESADTLREYLSSSPEDPQREYLEKIIKEAA